MLNKRKRVLIAITFTIIMIILTATTNIIEQYKSNENMILAVVWALTKNYKIRQIILIVAIFLYGKILLIKMSNLRSTLLQNKYTICEMDGNFVGNSYIGICHL